MTINAQSGPGEIVLFEDFFGVGTYITLQLTKAPAGDFYFGGESFEVNGAGAAYLQSDALSGVVKLTTDTTENDTIFVGTDIAFDVALMAPLVIEARVRFTDLDAKACFIGFTSVLTEDEQMSDIVDYSAATTLDITATMAGFYLSSELTDDEDWHMVYNGGTTTGQTDSTAIDADDDAVAGEWQILRVEVDPNGTARWYIDEEILQTVEGAISTSTDLAACCGISENAGGTAAVMDVDYLLVKANRDWNA